MDYPNYQMSDVNSSLPNHLFDTFSTPRDAYIANYKGPVDERWYIDSGATYHLTNIINNMHVREQFNGSDQLIIDNGQCLPITHIGDAFFTFKSSNVKQKHLFIVFKDILLVPLITKNILNILKLTADNNLSVEFLGNICFVNDSLKGQKLL